MAMELLESRRLLSFVTFRHTTVVPVGTLEQFAQTAGAAQIGAEHLLAGLLADGVAASILDKLGVTADAIAVAEAEFVDGGTAIVAIVEAAVGDAG